ncbi:MAG: carboxypeptidase-like regulatory domain-containing protein [Flavobacteriales bacterium]|nr:carboxypeptidase-like regulatory domain-containing protein [Flavobacteriales bacterium]
MGRYSIPPILLLFLLPMLAAGQTRTLVRGMVVDAETDRALHDAHVTVVGADLGTASTADGAFALQLPHDVPSVLRISLVGYATQERLVSRNMVQSGDVLRIRLVRQAIELPALTIQRAGPEVVYQREDLHVGDYFTNDEGLWVLTYEKPQLWHRENEAGKQVYRDGRLHLLNTDFVELCSVRLPSDVGRLRHDASYRAIVEGMDKAWVASHEHDEVRLQEISMKVLKENVLPWTDSIPGRLLGNNLDETFPAFEHFAYDPQSEETKAICAVQDDHLMELFRSQYKYMSGADKVTAMDLAIETGIDAEIIAGYMTQFHKDIYFDPPYAPLFVVKDTLCVFDHYTERIRKFLPDLSEVDAVPMKHHREKTWRTRLLQDRSDGIVYALFARNLHTWLRSVDVNTGELGPMRALDHPFPEEVQVHGGHAYFIYRPFGSLQHRTLYRQAIR